MAPSRRVPRPLEDLQIETALVRLHQALVTEDPRVRGYDDPAAAAKAHLKHCAPTVGPGRREEGLATPSTGARCCGKAITINYLVAEKNVHASVQPLYEAVVKAEPLLREAATLLTEPLNDMLQMLQQHQQALPSSELAVTNGAIEISRPTTNPPLLWVIDALRAFFVSLPRDAPIHHIHEQLLLLLNGLCLVLPVRQQIEDRLRREFPLPDLHETVAGAGRPALGLLNELTHFLYDTGHTPEQIASLLPDGGGDLGAVERVKDRLKSYKRKPRMSAETKDPEGG
ncbi:MAG: hypothetical protein ABI321_11485 [Polyangia bacterium]